MKRIIMVLLLALAFTAVLCASAPITADSPALITSFGQSADANFVKLLFDRLKLDYEYSISILPSAVDWSKIKALVCVLGGSQKGLGQAGLDMASEIDRCTKLLSDARAHGAKVIGIHLGGQDRMGPNSKAFIAMAAETDYMIVKRDTGVEDYFVPLCSSAGIPIDVAGKTADVSNLLKEIFGK